jgi:4-alpha-glucanotransferase
MHPLSLPGPAGCGDLGKSAHSFLEFLADGGQSLWQMLPLGPVGYGDSPYQCLSSMAGEPMLIGLDELVDAGLLSSTDLGHSLKGGRVRYPSARAWRMDRLHMAWQAFRSRPSHAWWSEFEAFYTQEGWWLHDFALFMTLRELNGQACWNTWSEAWRRHDPSALEQLNIDRQEDILRHKFFQFLFYRQLEALRRAANERGILLVGDMPIFVAFDSSDVWAWRKYFRVSEDGQPEVVAGVPPDYFSKTGQRWGNPLYRWDEMQQDDWWWWRSRFHMLGRQCDVVRVDHFRGFEACWEIPGLAPTAETGEWIKVPGRELFEALNHHMPDLKLIAEDLGLITPEVLALREDFGMPGMKIFQFGFFTDARDPFLPHNYEKECVAYTGTHDNDTMIGFLSDPENRHAARAMRHYLGTDNHEASLEAALDALWRSSANWCLAPMQDLLGLGAEGRMNLPGSSSGNWAWRMNDRWPRKKIAAQLSRLSARYARNLPAVEEATA